MKKFLNSRNSTPFSSSASEPLGRDSDSKAEREETDRSATKSCSLFETVPSFAESTVWQPTLDPQKDVAAMANLDTYSYFDGTSAHFSLADTTNSSKKRYRYRGFSSSISQFFLDESVVCGAFSCFGLLLSCRTVHLLQQRQRMNNSINEVNLDESNPLRRANTANYIMSLSLVVTLLLFFASFLLDPDSLGAGAAKPYSLSPHRSVQATSDKVLQPKTTTTARLAILRILDYSIFSRLPLPSWLVSFSENRFIRTVGEKAPKHALYQENYYADGDDYYAYEGQDFDSTIRQIALVFFLLLLAVYGTITRRKIRREILRARQQQDKAVTSTNPSVIIAPLGDGLNETSRQSACAHILCGFYPIDPPFPLVEDDEARQLKYSDCSQKLFSALSTACCGCLPFFSCWMQCFGVCALAQEAREAQKLLPVKDQRIDYITHQPWEEYEPQLVELRLANYYNSSKGSQPSGLSIFFEQFRAMSKCGKALWGIFLFLFIFVSVSMSQSHRHFGWTNAAVLVATFGQSFIMLYIVHRIYAKSYLSLDAVTKFFAAGFLLAVPSAFVLEMLVVNVFLVVMLLAYNLIYAGGVDSVVNFIYQHTLVFMVIFQFFNAFIVAAITEELCKYYVFRMVEHPDLSFMTNTRGSLAIKSVDSDGIQFKITHRQKAAAVTIAILSVALGLACAENFLYVFYLGGRDGGKASDEFMTLLFRSIFPIHALCAAMQSITVIKKYIELDPSGDPTNTELWFQRKKIGVGKTLTPAVLLHGSFDAVLMVVALFMPSDSETDDNSNQDDMLSSSEAFLNVFTWVSVISITICGALWYFRQKAEQKIRLQKLDDDDQNVKGSTQLVTMFRQALEMT